MQFCLDFFQRAIYDQRVLPEITCIKVTVLKASKTQNRLYFENLNSNSKNDAAS